MPFLVYLWGFSLGSKHLISVLPRFLLLIDDPECTLFDSLRAIFVTQIQLPFFVEMEASTLVGPKGPLFFCAPGCKTDYTSDGKSTFTRLPIQMQSSNPSEFPAAWAPGTTVRAKVLSGEKVPDGILRIIKATASSWSDQIASISLTWVNSNDFAEVRISFRNELPNWSCVGALATGYPQDKATMNFALGGWKQSRIVYAHSYIQRATAHLFGHALGL